MPVVQRCQHGIYKKMRHWQRPHSHITVVIVTQRLTDKYQQTDPRDNISM